MAAVTLVSQHDGGDIPCPYVQGATFTLEVTPPGGPALQIRARVVNAFEPFTMSPVMRVTLGKITSPPGATLAQFGLPMDAVLKVYDHRFAHAAREDWGLKPFTPEHEAEYAAYVNSPRAARTLAEMLSGVDQHDVEDADTEDNHSEHLLFEHLVALTTASFFTSECNAYERLASLQGRDIPIFYGTTRFLDGEAAPNLDLTKPGILLEYIEGTNLDSITLGQANTDFLARECLRIIETYSQLGVLNLDVRLGNFIVRPGGSGVVMVDFADSQLRSTGMTDYEWRKKKQMYDEEGEFRDSARTKWGLNLKRSYRQEVKC
ncbi:hypothetical protein RSOL_406050 [Rhizoctonia solani AG-3 Rhs1AP]|uniref:Protein kinase domain-containing protein n=2 Tax=Rhizoctonia solani AG-3 TaxID=1086053 RepID=A0A074S260_9AGAM|nr:hypothetical protein RSOL_406050 [Rhizoctonia solani AG-3 Rhs1AP]KEP53294.1 hypothetical protein V565_032900 [Rhizoctonia solani 123E]